MAMRSHSFLSNESMFSGHPRAAMPDHVDQRVRAPCIELVAKSPQ
jgi:hypothetical protein